MNMILKKQNIFVKSFIIIGFKLYPKCIMELDETFTSLFGKNGVGKTTFLDAIQIALIANQTYTKFNITTQKDDRSIGDYMLGSAGYIIFKISNGFSFGVRLLKNPDMKVEIKPFVLENTDIMPNDFFEENILIDNLTRLKTKLNLIYPQLEFKEFQSVTEYHEYLYEKEILSINISHRIYDFSLLYRSISTGILKQGTKMLKDILSTNKSNPKKLIDALTKSIGERKKIVSKINEIKTIKNEVENFEQAAKEYSDISFKYFCNELNVLKAKIENLKSVMEKNESLLKKTDIDLEENHKLLIEKEEKYKFIEEEYEKLLINISNFEKNYKAFENYTEITGKLELLLPEYNKSETLLNKINTEYEAELKNLENLKNEKNEIEKEKMRLEIEKRFLKEHYEKYKKFNENFELFVKITKENIKNNFDFEKSLNNWENIEKDIDNLIFLRSEFDVLNEKFKLHKISISQKSQLFDSGYEFKNKDDLIEINKNIEEEIFNLRNINNKFENEIEDKVKELDELLKGKIKLPDALKNYTGKFLYKSFDDIPIEKSRAVEAILGDLKFAPVISDDNSIKKLAFGKDRLFFIKSDLFNIDEFSIEETNDGYIIKDNMQENIIRYEPKTKYPVIGEKSRKQKAELLIQEIEELKNKITKNNENLIKFTNILSIIKDLINKFDYLNMTDIEEVLNDKKNRIEHIEKMSLIYNKVKSYLKNIKLLSAYYGRKDYEDEYHKLTDEINNSENKIKDLNENIVELNKKINNKLNNIKELQNKIKEIDAKINKYETLINQLKEEYPLEILKGEIDFTEIKKLHNEKDNLKKTKQKYLSDIDLIKDKKRELIYLQKKYVNEIKNSKENINILNEKTEDILNKAKLLTNKEILPQKFDINENDYYGAKAIFEKELNNFTKNHQKSIPQTSNILDLFNYSVVKVFPNYKSFENLQNDLERLHSQLLNIEDEIKNVIGNFNSSVIENIQNVKTTLRKLNNDLKNVRFGKIRMLKIKVVEREAYHKLQKIHQSGSIMSLLEGEDVNFEEFIKEMGKSLGYSKTQATEKDILDYKNYFDIEINLYDDKGNIRNKGLSNGENLGTNILIVLSMLMRLSEDGFKHKILPIILDEADRLDRDSINTLYEIAKNWGMQLIVALPNIPNFHKGMHYHLIASETGVVMPRIRYLDA